MSIVECIGGKPGKLVR